ncbi:Cytochrome P450 monooxygenase TRI13 [Colletotrichum viniferum]|nr:Cytochrome P450 monooxygenase TRI13 [Colletotrichum viniferum]
MRRTKELDRSDSIEHIFGPLFPQFHMLIKSQDPLSKRQRRWLQDLMTPGFLHNVAADPIYQNVLKVVELWDQKARLARGRPFAAFEDIYYGALDAVFSFSFGGAFAHLAIPARLEAVASMGGVEEPSKPGDPVLFPEEARNKVVDAILTLAESVEEARKAVFPRFRSWCMHQTSRINQAKRIRDDFIDREIDIAVERLKSQGTCRKPVFKSVGMHSEVFGFLMAGHETSATTFGWGLKYLTDHQDIQRTLRDELRRHLSEAAAERQQPTCEEITKTTIPYLDATMEEILRCAGTTSVTNRQALCDTTILGHRIPKDTNVILVTIGESIMKHEFDIPDSKRTKTADFQPARWLVPSKDDADREVFDATAGPQMAFGLGPRAFFGRRLAYLELKMFTVLLFWNFELLRCPDELSGYNGCVGLTVKPTQCYVRLRKVSW